MENRYKAILSGKNLYKEIEVSNDNTKVVVGTAAECDVRLRKNYFLPRLK